MPIKDLLWACPICSTVEGIDQDGCCRTCDTQYRRGRGAAVAARVRGSRSHWTERQPLEWLNLLPWPDLDGEGHALPAALAPPFEQRVLVRTATLEQPLRRAGRFLGAIERYGAKRQGVLRLESERLIFTAQSGAGNDPGFAWRLQDLTAIQPASSTIQLKARAEPVVSIRFLAGSVRLWEQRLKYCTRVAYHAAGRGEVTEYQPRIRVR